MFIVFDPAVFEHASLRARLRYADALDELLAADPRRVGAVELEELRLALLDADRQLPAAAFHDVQALVRELSLERAGDPSARVGAALAAFTARVTTAR